MKINRPALDAELRAFVRAGHGLVVGRPGVGKTHSLNELAGALTDEGTLYLFIAVDELGDASEEDLRLALGYEARSFVQQLEALFGAAGSGVLIIDGFDAARHASTRARLLGLVRAAVRRAPQGWSVIVSVRNYDAAKSPALLELFPEPIVSHGAAPSALVPSPAYRFPRITARHFAIPELTDDEAKGAMAQIPEMVGVIPHVSDGFMRLAHVPFNLWLIERIVRMTDSERLGALESETELLNLFWTAYVTATPEAAFRTLILRRVTNGMVRERRLAVRIADVYSTDVDAAWDILLSAEVIVATGDYVQFRHNILFDYAVSELAIADAVSDLVAFLKEDPSRPLFLRPSLVYYFSRRWHGDRPAFWRTYWHLLTVDDIRVRLVGRIIPPFVMAQECRSTADLEPLLQHSPQGPDQRAEPILRVLQALRFVEVPNPDPWVSFAVKATRVVDRVFAWELAAFLGRVVRVAKAGQLAQRGREIGEAAHTLFAWAWERRQEAADGWFDAFAAIHAVPLVLETFDVDMEKGSAVVRRVLGLLSEPDFPIRYFDALTGGLAQVVAHAPAVAAEVYRAVFGHEERSTAPTHVGGIIMPLTSNRRQDFSMSYYVLAKEYPQFLRAAPFYAIPVAIDVLNQVSIRNHILPYLREGKTIADLTERFRFVGAERSYTRDFSATWWPGLRDEAGEMADAVVSWLTSESAVIEPTQAVALFANHAVVAASWARLLEVGAGAPIRYANLLIDLAMARPVQLGYDTLQPLGTFVERAAQYWNERDRGRFEQSVLALVADSEPEGTDRVEEAHAVIVRDRLLDRVPRELLTQERSRMRVDALMSRGTVPGNEPLSSLSVWSAPYTESEWLADQGVDTHAAGSVPFTDLADAMDSFMASWRNKAPEASSIEAVLPAIASGLDLLSTADSKSDKQEALDTPDPLLIEHTWAKLAAAAHIVARSRPLPESAAIKLARRVLLRAAARGAPDVSADADAVYTNAAWSPTARTEAIQGLAYLASAATSADPAIANAFKELARSAEPAERFLATQYAVYLARPWPDVFWPLVTERARDERNVVVATALLRTLWNAAPFNHEKASELVRQFAMRRVQEEQFAGNSDFLRAVAGWLVYLATARDDQWAWKALDREISEPSQSVELLNEIVRCAADEITPERLAAQGGDRAKRAFTWLVDAVESMRRRAAILLKASSRRDRVPEGGHSTSEETMASEPLDQELARFHRVIDTLVTRLYLNGRRQDKDKKQGRNGGDVEWAEPKGERGLRTQSAYYRAIAPIMRAILTFAGPEGSGVLVAGTAHHFMELLNDSLASDVKNVVSMAADVTVAATASGYQFDSLAVQEVVRLVETVLADHKDVLVEGPPLTDTLRMLDVFADAGWPDAMRLVWRLDEVFR